MFKRILLLTLTCCGGASFASHRYSRISDRPAMSSSLAQGVLTIANAKEVTSEMVKKLCGSWRENIEEVRIEGDVDRIGDYAFYGCTSLKKVTFPQTLTHIGCSAFEGLESLETIKFLPSSEEWSRRLKAICGDAFRGCTSLKKIDFPMPVKTVAGHVFSECTSLEEVNFSMSVRYIGHAAFSGCKSLKRVVLGGGANVEVCSPIAKRDNLIIGHLAFENCTKLTQGSLIINDIVDVYVDDEAFEGCSRKFIKNPYSLLEVTPEIKIKKVGFFWSLIHN